jgi:hypothetical protein
MTGVTERGVNHEVDGPGIDPMVKGSAETSMVSGLVVSCPNDSQHKSESRL